MSKNRIYFLCPDNSKPAGGIKQLYRHVDILNKNGFSAFILHAKKGFRCSWFENDTKIAYNSNIFNPHYKELLMSEEIKKFLFSRLLNPLYMLKCIIKFLTNSKNYRNQLLQCLKNIYSDLVVMHKYKDVKIDASDYLVIPETYGPNIADIAKGVRKVIFNQNAYYTFDGYSFDKNESKTPYFNEDVISVIVVSEDNFDYLKFTFPRLNITRVHYGIDYNIFQYSPFKKKQISFMSRKLPEQIRQVINILKFRDVLWDFELTAIESKTETEVARILQDSLIFLSFSTQEGFGMPPMEAMACGCIVIGYDGNGGKEYFNEEFCYPVEAEDILNFAKNIEVVINEYRRDGNLLLKKGKTASEFVLNMYSMEKESKDVIDFWKKL